MDGATSKLDDVASSGLDVGRILGLGVVPGSCKVSVCKAFDDGVPDVHDEALLPGAHQIAHDSLSSGAVCLLRVVAEFGALVCCEGDVGPSGGCQVVELTYQRAVVEGSFLRWNFRSIGVLEQETRGWSWANVEGFHVKVGCFDDFVNQVGLRHLDACPVLDDFET